MEVCENLTSHKTTIAMIRILSKDSIMKYIIPHLSRPKRGGSSVPIWELVNAIFYKFKSGVQWHLLPVKSLIYRNSIKYGAIYHHFRKWVKDSSWQKVEQQIISRYKSLLNLSVASFDRTHSQVKRGGEQVAYQGRKKYKTSNTLWLTAPVNPFVVAGGQRPAPSLSLIRYQ